MFFLSFFFFLLKNEFSAKINKSKDLLNCPEWRNIMSAWCTCRLVEEFSYSSRKRQIWTRILDLLGLLVLSRQIEPKTFHVFLISFLINISFINLCPQLFFRPEVFSRNWNIKVFITLRCCRSLSLKKRCVLEDVKWFICYFVPVFL